MSDPKLIPLWQLRALPWLAGLALAGALLAAQVAHAQDDVQIHGFVSQGILHSSEYNYLGGETRSGYRGFNEAAVNFSTSMSDELRVGLQIFSRDLGDFGNNELTLDWAFGDYRLRDWLGFRVGRAKLPYGLYNEVSDYDMVRTSVFLPQSVYDSRFRDLLVAYDGLGIYGSRDLASAGSFDYQLFAGGLNVPSDGSVAAFFEDATQDYDADPDPDPSAVNYQNTRVIDFGEMDVDHVAGGQILWNTPLEGMRLGYSHMNFAAKLKANFTPTMEAVLDAQFGAAGFDVPSAQTYNIPKTDFKVWSAEYTNGPFVFAGEYSLWKGTFNNEFDDQFAAYPGADPRSGFANVLDLEIDWERWYVQGSWRANERFEFGAYYSVYYQDRKDKDGDDYDYPGPFSSRSETHHAFQKDLTLSARIDLTDAMIFKLETHIINGTAGLLTSENSGVGSITPGGEEDSWMLFAAKTSFIF